MLISRDPLPTGRYRIRSYNGQYLLTMSNDWRVYITRQMQGMELRRQTVAFLSIFPLCRNSF